MKEEIAFLLSKKVPLSKPEILNLIEVPPSPELGDYAFPCFSLAREMKKNPAEIANELSKKIKSNELEKVESKGPYINFFLNRHFLASSILKEVLKKKDKYGSPSIKRKAVIEFPSPNTNKPLHIGHARNLVIGQAVSNLLRFSGNTLNIVNLNNDRGVHICKSMLAYEKFGKNDSPEKSMRKSDHFVGDYYVKFAQASKEHPALEQEAQEMLQKWEKGDKKTLNLWKKMNNWALSGFRETYKKFGYKPDKEFFESDIYNKGKKIILSSLKEKKIYVKDDGAIAINLEKEGYGEKILLRADGTSIYITQDIYLALLKQKKFKPDASIIISATEQNYHFKVLFTVLEKLGFSWSKTLSHLSYGMVNLESGRMKSREGTVVDSDDLIKEMESLALTEIEKRYKNLSDKEKKLRAEAIALAALRYYFLKIEKGKDMTFKPEESIQFEGDTGPYLLYTYARAKSIIRKSNSSKKLSIPKSISDSEKNLLKHLSVFSSQVSQAYQELAPHIIATYVFQLAKLFNEFYHAERVIGSEKESFRLALVECTAQVLKNGLHLLNIYTLEEM